MTGASDRDGEPTPAPELEAEVLRVGAGTTEEGEILIAIELRVENAGPPTRVGGWAVRVRLTDGTTVELPLHELHEPTTFGYPRGGDRTVEPESSLSARGPEQPMGTADDLGGVLVCRAAGLESEELLANGVLYTVSVGNAEDGELEVRHLLSVGPVGGDAPGYFPGLAGT